jgi:hypothetical protein
MRKTNNTGISVCAGWRADLERKMREVALSPESHFPERRRLAMDLVEQQDQAAAPNIGAAGSRLGSIEERVDIPESADRVVALTFFFQVAGFVRLLTPQMLSKVSDDEIKFLAICLGLDSGVPQSLQRPKEI